MATREVCF